MKPATITDARHVCSICGFRTDNRHVYAGHRNGHGRPPAPGSRRFVVELGCGHSYGALFAADRPCVLEPGMDSRCMECGLDAPIRRVS